MFWTNDTATLGYQASAFQMYPVTWSEDRQLRISPGEEKNQFFPRQEKRVYDSQCQLDLFYVWGNVPR